MGSELLDSFDKAILAILQDDSRTPQRTIGGRIHLSAPAVQRRIKRMEAAGIIKANVAVLDPAALGQNLTIFVEVELVSETIADIDAAKERFLSSRFVQQCYYVTGDVDFVLIVIVPTMSIYEDLTRTLFFANANVKRFKTFVAMDRVKVSLGVPIECQDRE